MRTAVPRIPQTDTAVKQVGKAEPAPRDRMHVASLARGLAVLRAFTPERRELGSSAIGRIIGLPQPTVWRLCKTLLDEGYLMQTPGGDRFQLSPLVLSLGYSALANLPMAEIARAPMQALADRHAAGVSLGLLEGGEMLLVQRCQGPQATLVLNLHVGSRLPLADSAMGTTYLAALSEVERAPIVAALEQADPARWPRRRGFLDQAQGELARLRYFANEGVFHRQISTVAVPLRGADGRLYVITCGTPAGRMSLDALHGDLAPDVLRVARTLDVSASPPFARPG